MNFCIIFLVGALLVQRARSLGIKDMLTSDTFMLVASNESYQGKKQDISFCLSMIY
jgi:hypothetical protein